MAPRWNPKQKAVEIYERQRDKAELTPEPRPPQERDVKGPVKGDDGPNTAYDADKAKQERDWWAQSARGESSVVKPYRRKQVVHAVDRDVVEKAKAMDPAYQASRESWWEWLREDMAARASRDATRASLVKLARACLDAHIAAIAADVVPRDSEGGSQPLAAMISCLQTIRNR
jgi:hypothetical protein